MATTASRSGPAASRRRHRRLPGGLGERDPTGEFSDRRLEVHPEAYLVRANGEVVSMTPTKLALLVELVRHRGAVCTREQLYEAVWGRRMPRGTRIVDITLVRVRAKLAGALGDAEYIHTHPHLGYRFEPPAAN
jgi:DNA-binding response OmpR family regulator